MVRSMRRGLTMVVGSLVAALALAGPVNADPSGPTAFYFAANCTGLGDVLLVNAGPSRTAALQVVGSTTVLLIPVNPALRERANTVCTITAAGPDPANLQPIPGGAFTDVAVIVP